MKAKAIATLLALAGGLAAGPFPWGQEGLLKSLDARPDGMGMFSVNPTFTGTFGSDDSSSFRAFDIGGGAAVSPLPFITLNLAFPYHIDSYNGASAAGTGDLHIGTKLSWQANTLFAVAAYGFVTVPTGADTFSGVRDFSTNAVDYGGLLATTLTPGNGKFHIILNAGFYNLYQQPYDSVLFPYGSLPNVTPVYAGLGYDAGRFRPFAEVTWDLLFSRYTLPEQDTLIGSTPVRIGLGTDIRFSKFIGAKVGLAAYVTPRSIETGGQNVYPGMPHLMPRQDPQYEFSAGLWLRKPGKKADEIPSDRGIVDGIVKRGDTDEPVACIVQVEGTEKVVETGRNGKFYFEDIRPGMYLIHADPTLGPAMAGVANVEVKGGKRSKFEIILEVPEPGTLAVLVRPLIGIDPLKAALIVKGTGKLEGTDTVGIAEDTVVYVLYPGRYLTTAGATGFYSQNVLASVGSKSRTFLRIVLPPMEITKAFPEVYFSTGSHRIKKAMYPALDSVGRVVKAILQANSYLRLEIAGYADIRGGVAYNLRLAENRAKSVMTYLVENHDIDPDRIFPKGYGEDHPVEPNTDAAGMQSNRRVEFRLLELKVPSQSSPEQTPSTSETEGQDDGGSE